MAVYETLEQLSACQAGDISRVEGNIILAGKFATEIDVEAGKPVVANSDGNFEYLTASNISNGISGIVSRTYPAGSGFPAGLKIPKGRLIGVQVHGFILVKCDGNPKMGNQVYVYVTADDTHAVGDITATPPESEAANIVKLHGYIFSSSGLTANGLAEVVRL